MEIGQFRDRLTFFEPSVAPTESGIKVTVLNEKLKCWAKKIRINVRDFVNDETTEVLNRGEISFLVRYELYPKIDMAYKVLYKNEYYDVVAKDSDENYREFCTLKIRKTSR